MAYVAYAHAYSANSPYILKTRRLTRMRKAFNGNGFGINGKRNVEEKALAAFCHWRTISSLLTGLYYYNIL